jgi:hypothetical protein
VQEKSLLIARGGKDGIARIPWVKQTGPGEEAHCVGGQIRIISLHKHPQRLAVITDPVRVEKAHVLSEKGVCRRNLASPCRTHGPELLEIRGSRGLGIRTEQNYIC